LTENKIKRKEKNKQSYSGNDTSLSHFGISAKFQSMRLVVDFNTGLTVNMLYG